MPSQVATIEQDGSGAPAAPTDTAWKRPLRRRLLPIFAAVAVLTGASSFLVAPSASAQPPYVYCGRLTIEGQWKYFQTCYNYDTVWYIYTSGTGQGYPFCAKGNGYIYRFDFSVYDIHTRGTRYTAGLPAPC
jgi:hypothetical protein